jgi:hypothetical protein
MGLNAVAYGDVRFLGKKILTEDYEFHMYNMDDTSQNVKKEGYYTGKRLYSTGNVSYSTYGDHRKKLCKAVTGLDAVQVWDNPHHDLPFIEMINFSDCEGGFDNEVCKELKKDFTEWKSKIEKEFKDDIFFLDFYKRFLTLFETASDNNGIVVYN